MAQVVSRGKDKYCIRVFLGRDAVSGKPRFHNVTVRGGKREAMQQATRLQHDRDAGRLIGQSRQSVYEFLQSWLETKQGIQRRTLSDYRGLIERHIRDSLGGLRLRRITPAHIQLRCNELTRAGLSPRTVKYVRDVLHMAFEYGVLHGHMTSNPAKRVELPRIPQKDWQPLTPAQVNAFLTTGASDRWYALWLLLVTSGLRPSEALGLRWSDVNFETAEVAVRRVLTRVDGEGYSFHEPKTSKSRRTVAIPQTTARALQAHRARQAEERLSAGASYGIHDLVFAATDGQPLDYRVVVRRHFKPLLKRAGLPEIRPYDLRHTSATLALRTGVPIKVLSERLGHSTAKMTLDVYQHVSADMQRNAADALELLLFTPPASDRARA